MLILIAKMGCSHDHLLLMPSGNIGIGISDPVEKLHIRDANLRIDSGEIRSWGQITLSPDIDNSGDKWVVIQGSLAVEGGIWTSVYGGKWQSLRNYADNSSLNIWWGQNQNSPSDRLLKKSTHAITGALSQIEQLKPVSFYWQDTDYFLDQFDQQSPPSSILSEEELNTLHQDRETVEESLYKQQFGFIAQDLEEIFPDWVTTGEDGYKRINLRMLPPFLVKSIQELKQKCDALEAENQYLSGRLEALEKRLKKLEECC